MIVVLTAEAESDLESIAEYIAHDSVAAALSLVHELREKCFALAEAPRGYPLVRATNIAASAGAHLAVT